MGGAANHWNGQTWRWGENDPVLRTHLESRYGKKAIPADMAIQDWGVTYAEMEPHHDQFEKLFGIAGKAGNLRGKVQEGGNPFEAPRQNEFPQKPLPITEAGVIFTEAAKKLGYKPFPLPAANSPEAYTNPDGMQLGQCQFCGHCERFICEANAKASPEVLLYPMLRKRKGFELRLQTHVLEILYDRKAKRATGVRYIDRVTGEEYEQPADVVVLSSFTMSNTKFLLMARDRDALQSEDGSRGRRQEFLPPDNVRHARFLQGSLDQPVPGVRCLTDRDRRIQRRQFRPQRPWLPWRRLHLRQRDEWTTDYESSRPPWHSEMGLDLEEGQRRLVCSQFQHICARQLVSAP